MVLERAEVEHLLAVAEVHREEVALGALTVEAGLAAQARVVAAERDRGGRQPRVATEMRALQRDRPRAVAVLLHADVADVRVVADRELDDAVDEMRHVRRRRVPFEDRDLALLLGHDERVREGRETFAVGPVQDHDRALDHHAARHMHERTAREERIVQHGERVGRRTGDGTEVRLDGARVARGDSTDGHTQGRELGIELVVHDAPVAHHDEAGPLARFGGDRAAAGRSLASGAPSSSAVIGRNRVEVELVDARVPPDLFGVGGPDEPGELSRRRPRATSQSGPPSAPAASGVNK